MLVPKRSSSQTIQAKGVYPGARVERGPDWAAKYKDQDGKNRFPHDEVSKQSTDHYQRVLFTEHNILLGVTRSSAITKVFLRRLTRYCYSLTSRSVTKAKR